VCIRRFVLVPCLALVSLLLYVGVVSAAELRLDRSFGDGGVVYLDSEDTAGPYVGFGPMAGAGDGGAFVVETTYHAGRESRHLTRYRPDGRRDAEFGRVTVVRQARDSWPLLSVDRRGRPVLAWTERRQVVVQRYLGTGRPDRTFGGDGKVKVTLDCGRCLPGNLLVGPRERLTLIGEPSSRNRHFKGSIPFFLRLRENGALDRSFSGDGIARPRLRGTIGIGVAAADRSGGLVFSGFVCCGAEDLPYVRRLTRKGKIDRRFGAATAESIKRLRPWTQEYLWWRSDLMVRPDGRIVLLTNLEGRGTLLQLRRDGRLDRNFGQNGGRRLPWVVADGELDASGEMTVVAEAARRGNVAYSLYPNGRLDRGSAVDLPRSDAVESIWTEAQPHGRVLVFDGDFHECRGSCPSQPRIYRLKVGRQPTGHRRGGG
jgi:hypothetical protein